jgi:phage repressor protein C with HTH and peptisase S24 domain
MNIDIMLKQLDEKGFTRVNPRGNSMKGRINSGQTTLLVKEDSYKVDDIVFCKVKGSYYIHLIKKVGDRGYLITNNKGRENGWTKTIFAKAYIEA